MASHLCIFYTAALWKYLYKIFMWQKTVTNLEDAVIFINFKATHLLIMYDIVKSWVTAEITSAAFIQTFFCHFK